MDTVAADFFSLMKTLPLVALLIVSPFVVDTVVAQDRQLPFPVTPATPTDFTTRKTGVTASGSAVARAIPAKKVSYNYIAVSSKREWTNNGDKTIVATLLAYETGQLDKTKSLTIVRDGKIRLLKDGTVQPSLVDVKTLSEADQAHVEQVVKANQLAPKKQEDGDEG